MLCAAKALSCLFSKSWKQDQKSTRSKPDWRYPRCQSVQCVQCVQNVQSECSMCSMCIMCTMCSMFSMCQCVHKNKTISLLDVIIKTVMQ